MSADALVFKLEGVRSTGPGRWIARCPAHDDRSPSLSIRQLEDGRVLVHCFASCSVEEVLAAVGLEFDALFPERSLADHVLRERRLFPAGDVLQALAGEALLVAVAASNIAQGVMLTDADRQRLAKAAGRIEAARGLANGER